MCPDINGTELLYSGRAAGSRQDHRGGGSNYICLPDEPEFLSTTSGVQGDRSYVYGTAYNTANSPPALGNLIGSNAPCAVCITERTNKIMIPGKFNCPPLWTREYYGYLMTEQQANYRNSFECVDVEAEAVPGSGSGTSGALFYFAEARCTGLACPPYVEGHELTCVVCTM